MRRRVLLVVFLCLLAGAFAMAQVFHLLPPADTASAPHESVASAHEPAAAVDRSFAGSSSEAPSSSSSSEENAAGRVKSPDGSDHANAAASKSGDASANGGVKLDLAEISTSGATSVFAGRAAPGASVTVRENGVAVASATANANGDWSLATDHKFAGPDPKFDLSAGPPKTSDERPAASGDKPSAVASAAKSGDVPAAQHVSPSVTLLKNFESVVATARKDAQAEHQTESSAASTVEVSPPAVPAASAPAPEVSMSAPSSSEHSVPEQLPSATIPVPMTFVFDEATLTTNGEKTARLLLDYVLLKKFKSIALTGHADERGTAEYNMELSSKRLDAIAAYLRSGGYRGEMKLLPEGATQPFTGIDRSKFSRDDLMQLDRRVELRNAM